MGGGASRKGGDERQENRGLLIGERALNTKDTKCRKGRGCAWRAFGGMDDWEAWELEVCPPDC